MTLTMKLARAIHFDESDQHVFHAPARTGEWCISGGFEFSNFTQSDLVGKTRQAFANGWLGLETSGRVTFVAVTHIEEAELNTLIDRLAHHFVTYYGAPSLEAARPVAEDEIAHMRALCEDHAANTVLTVSRELTAENVREDYRVITPNNAALEQFAIHHMPDAPE